MPGTGTCRLGQCAIDPDDLHVRQHVYGRFVELGRAPTLGELEQELGPNVGGALRRLDDAHALVLDPATGELRMANPFSAVPTPHRVEAAGRSWYANCAWDAFGIPAALHVDGHISSSCPDCGEAIQIDIRDARPDPDEHVFHVLVPAAHWWDDIVFT
jgi:Alkylmercury lyase